MNRNLFLSGVFTEATKNPHKIIWRSPIPPPPCTPNTTDNATDASACHLTFSSAKHSPTWSCTSFARLHLQLHSTVQRKSHMVLLQMIAALEHCLYSCWSCTVSVPLLAPTAGNRRCSSHNLLCFTVCQAAQHLGFSLRRRRRVAARPPCTVP